MGGEWFTVVHACSEWPPSHSVHISAGHIFEYRCSKGVYVILDEEPREKKKMKIEKAVAKKNPGLIERLM